MNFSYLNIAGFALDALDAMVENGQMVQDPTVFQSILDVSLAMPLLQEPPFSVIRTSGLPEMHSDSVLETLYPAF